MVGTKNYENVDPRIRAFYYISSNSSPPNHDTESFNVILASSWGQDKIQCINNIISMLTKGNEIKKFNVHELNKAMMDGK